MPLARAVLALRVASSTFNGTRAPWLKFLISRQGEGSGKNASLVAENGFVIQGIGDGSDYGVEDEIKKQTVFGVEIVVLDVEPVILLFFRENDSHLIISRYS